jgi:hypothetical protein
LDEQKRKADRKAAKKIIKVAKEHPSYYTKEDVRYAKLIKRRTKKHKSENDKT